MTSSSASEQGSCSSQKLVKGVRKLQLKRSATKSARMKSPLSHCGLMARPAAGRSPLHSPAHGPGTPEAEEALAPRSSAYDGVLGLELARAVRAATKVYHKNLVKLQPIVEICSPAIEGAVVLLEAAARANPALLARLRDSCKALLTAAAAALWVCAKVMGVRGSTPSGALLAQASQLEVAAVVDFEAELLSTLEWDITSLLRKAGVLLA